MNNDAPPTKQAKTEGDSSDLMSSKDGVKFSVFNATDKLLGRAWELTLGYTGVGDSGSSMQNTPAFPPQEWTECTCPGHSFSDKLILRSSCHIEITKEGLEFEGGLKKVFVVEGGKYTVQHCADCPPLKDAEFKKARDMLLELNEGFGPFPVPTDDVQLTKVWTWITEALGRPVNEKNVAAVGKMVTDGTCQHNGRIRCRQRMETHPRKPVVDASIPLADLKTALTGNTATIVIYHRALDRFPGGNSDQHVIKHKVDLSRASFECLHWLDWDGSSQITSKPCVLSFAKNKKSIFEKLVPAIVALLDSSPESKTREFSWTIDDPQTDSEEYDTEWSSIEILVYLDSAMTKLGARFHQYALYKNWYGFMGSKDTDADDLPSTDLHKNLIESAGGLCKLGRVEGLSEDQSAVFGKAEYHDIRNIGYTNPIYLN